MTNQRKLNAIKARINGEWDHPDLLELGPLLPNTAQDLLRILELTETERTQVADIERTLDDQLQAIEQE